MGNSPCTDRLTSPSDTREARSGPVRPGAGGHRTGGRGREAADDKQNQAAAAARVEKRRASRGALPAHLPRVHVTIEPEDGNCPCCRSPMHVIGDDVSERLDMVPAQFRVMVTRRPKYACRDCEGDVVQAPAPEHLIEGGIPTEAMIAAVVIAKYAGICRSIGRLRSGRQGVELDRSTLADWSGRAAELRPVYERLRDILKSGKLAADETRAPVLDPGRGSIKNGQLWAYARDDRPWGGAEPPAVAFVYEPDRGASTPRSWPTIRGLSSSMATPPTRRWPQGQTPVTLAFCWAHVRRRFFDQAAKRRSP